MKAKVLVFSTAFLFIALGAYDIGVYANSGYLGTGIFMLGEGFLVGMMMSWVK